MFNRLPSIVGIVSIHLVLCAALSQAPARAADPPASGAAATSAPNLLLNGGFDGSTLRPWSLNFDSSRGGHGALVGGELCIQIDQPGTHRYDVVLRQGPLALNAGHHYQVRFRTHATAPARLRARVSKIGAPYAEYWSAIVDTGSGSGASASDTPYSATFDATADQDNAELVFELGGDLAAPTPFSVCLDDIQLSDPQFEPPVERAAPPPPRVSVNQVGYLPALSKIATVATAATSPLDWQLIDHAGRIVASGKTRPIGDDLASGEHVHQIDFTAVTAPGTGLKLRVGVDESVPFDIGAGVYHRLKYDALAFFYLQRSGVPITMPYAGTAAYERPPGHPGDRSVACAPEAPCAYRLDVSGGWYDAGDHGKYVVNSGISVWMLQNQYETLSRFGATAGDFADGKMNIPERANGRPDLLDEARFNLEFMLRMQVPAGQPLAGMAHHKVHDNKWSPIPTLPDRDTLPRYLRPPSTAATYDLAATAAQAARIWRALDPSFAARCLSAAEIAFAAATKNPRLLPERDTPGGGAYGDGDLEDERFWAAAELFISTGESVYKDELDRSRYAIGRDTEAAALSALNWDRVAGLGVLSLAMVPNKLADADVAALRRQIAAAGDHLLAVIGRAGYRMPLAADRVYVWGSNVSSLDAAVVLGAAYELTQKPAYANGVVDSIDYILGRNPLAQSYVAGYGARAMRNPHHRVWAHQKDPTLPEAPPGAVSGGPNSMMQDPYIRKLGKGGCPAQTCYVDNIESYSTNEVAINWNAPLAWAAAFLDDVAHHAAVMVRPAATK